MQVLLISTYELGRQPFGLASPAAWLRRDGAEVHCLDLAVEPFSEELVRRADLIAIHLPMHTATRIAGSILPRIRAINSRAHLCCYGLYAPVNEAFLRGLGVQTILGGEFEEGLAGLARELSSPAAVMPKQVRPLVSLARQQFLVPERRGLPSLTKYARLATGTGGAYRLVGYTEASRGCKHLCRHCPIVPVYNGRFRVVQREVVLADVERQVEAGAEHITFGDPDFFNGPAHAVRIVEALHARFPRLTYDVTIKIEHLLRHAEYLPNLRDTGCLFVTSAVESIDDRILEIFDKRHTRDDFVRAAALLREVGLTLNPTFVTFTPWTTLRGYRQLLATLLELDLIHNVSPIQYAIRLLIPAGSKLLERTEVRALVGEFDRAALCYPWSHPDPAVDRLHEEILATVGSQPGRPRCAAFKEVWSITDRALREAGAEIVTASSLTHDHRRAPVPYLTEPWYC